MRSPVLRVQVDGLIVDNFAGGGGASTGIEWATGRSPDIAVNHDREAIAVHKANHPNTRHFCEDVFAVDPTKVCGGKKVGLAWFSPDCTFFSKSRGGKPFRDRNRARRRRGLAGVVLKWAAAVRPAVIALENVEEFQDWGPLGTDGLPCPLRKGFSFRRWLARLEAMGYVVEMRQLRACDYGAPTIRKRLFIIARCDGKPIVWPVPTHAARKPGRKAPAIIGLKPYRTAAECIDWSLPCRSIFDRPRPLAEPTLRRIARGTVMHVLEAAEPFIVPVTHPRDLRVHPIGEPLRTITAGTRGEHALVEPFLLPYYGDRRPDEASRARRVDQPLPTATTAPRFSLVAPTLIATGRGERPGQAPRSLDIAAPLGTVCAGGSKHALVAAFLARHYSDRPGGGWAGGMPLDGPAGTVTTQDHHALVTAELAERGGERVHAFLMAYYGTEQRASLRAPLPTITTHDRFALVTVAGIEMVIVDIAMRMLAAHELAAAQGFPPGYRLAVEIDGKVLSKTAQIRLVGNSVCPDAAAALLSANFDQRRARRPAEQLRLRVG